MAKYITQEFYNFYSNFVALNKKITNIDLFNALEENNIIGECGVVTIKNKINVEITVNKKEYKFTLPPEDVLRNDDYDEIMLSNAILKYIIKNKLLKKKRGKN